MLIERKLHGVTGRSAYWARQSMQKRVAALEIIRGTTNDSVHVQQPFPRVLRIRRNKLATPRGKDKIDAEELQKIKLKG